MIEFKSDGGKIGRGWRDGGRGPGVGEISKEKQKESAKAEGRWVGKGR